MYRILLAEDNPGDVLLFREALKTRNLRAEIHLAEDGQKAIDLITGKLSGDSLQPDLIVLDVNLPKHTGSEVLQQIRCQEALARVPVIMLTSSSSPSDRERAKWLGADLYLQKPSDLDGLLEVARIIEEKLGSTG